MKIHAENLIIALNWAIERQWNFERTYGYVMDSAMLAGWIKTRDALVNGEDVEIKGVGSVTLVAHSVNAPVRALCLSMEDEK